MEKVSFRKLFAFAIAIGAAGLSTMNSPNAVAQAKRAVTPNPAAIDSRPLRIVMPAEPASFNPVPSLYTTLRIVGNLFDPLVGFNKQTLEPNESGLLTSWSRISPTEWRFKVRSGVKFHNGEVWDANAAAFSILKYRDEPRSGFAPYYKRVVEAKAESPNSLIVRTNLPYIALPKVLTTAMGLPPAYYEQATSAGFGKHPVGTGPFEFESLSPGQSFAVKAFDKYWGGKPKLSGITMSWAADASTRVALLQSGGADLVADLPNDLLDDVQKTKGLTVLNAPSLYKMTISMNTNVGALTDLRLRKAVQSAIDYDGIVKTLFGGVGARKSPYYTGDLIKPSPVLTYQKYDPKAASALVAAVGGRPKLRYLYPTGFYPKDKQVGEAVSAMLEAVGFEVEQMALDNSKLREQRAAGNYSLYMVHVFPVFAHPDSFIAFFTGTNAAVKNCTDPKGYDALTEQGLSAKTDAESIKIYTRIEKKVMDEDACNAVLYDQVASYGLSTKVKGFSTALDAFPLMHNVYIER
jgi:peptide/nickel transport system substrate-binding protein